MGGKSHLPGVNNCGQDPQESGVERDLGEEVAERTVVLAAAFLGEDDALRDECLERAQARKREEGY